MVARLSLGLGPTPHLGRRSASPPTPLARAPRFAPRPPAPARSPRLHRPAALADLAPLSAHSPPTANGRRWAPHTNRDRAASALFRCTAVQSSATADLISAHAPGASAPAIDRVTACPAPRPRPLLRTTQRSSGDDRHPARHRLDPTLADDPTSSLPSSDPFHFVSLTQPSARLVYAHV